jgi:hypothetical protein
MDEVLSTLYLLGDHIVDMRVFPPTPTATMATKIPRRDQRLKTIPVKVSEGEKKLIEAAARRLGQRTGAWLRMLGLEAAGRTSSRARIPGSR